MKQLIVVMFIALVVFSCSERQGPSIEGRYTLHRIDEFGQIWDTLYLYPVNERIVNVYRLVKVSGILRRRLDDTVMLPKRRQEEPSIAVTYDPKAQILKDEYSGMIYSVDPQAGTINDGRLTFSKVK